MKALQFEIENFEDLLEYVEKNSLEQILLEGEKSMKIEENPCYADLSLEEFHLSRLCKPSEPFVNRNVCFGAKVRDFVRSFLIRKDDYVKIYHHLADETSKKVFFQILMARLIPPLVKNLEPFPRDDIQIMDVKNLENLASLASSFAEETKAFSVHFALEDLIDVPLTLLDLEGNLEFRYRYHGDTTAVFPTEITLYSQKKERNAPVKRQSKGEKSLYHRISSFSDLMEYFKSHDLEEIYAEISKSIYMCRSPYYRDKAMEDCQVHLLGSFDQQFQEESHIFNHFFHTGQVIDSIYTRQKDYEKIYDFLSDDQSKQCFFQMLMVRLLPSCLDFAKSVRTMGYQYFRKELIPDCKNGVYVDCGCYDGETVQEFIQVYGENYKKIHFFEPIPSLYEKCVKATAEFPFVFPHPLGIGAEEGSFSFDDLGAGSKMTEQGQITAEVVTLDSHITDKIDFLKMDIEGAEMSALQGAVMHLINDKPITTISLYHQVEDLIDIPLFLYFLNPEQKFFIRYHGYKNTDLATDIVLYTVPNKG